MPTHILVPVDGSERSWEALEYATDLFDDVRLTVLYVIDPAVGDYYLDDESNEPVEQSAEIRETTTERLRAVAGDDHDVEVVIESGKPAQTIIEYTDANDVDHVVIGSRGRSGVRRLLLGSVAETVIRRSSVPVTVTREREDEE